MFCIWTWQNVLIQCCESHLYNYVWTTKLTRTWCKQGVHLYILFHTCLFGKRYCPPFATNRVGNKTKSAWTIIGTRILKVKYFWNILLLKKVQCTFMPVLRQRFLCVYVIVSFHHYYTFLFLVDELNDFRVEVIFWHQVHENQVTGYEVMWNFWVERQTQNEQIWAFCIHVYKMHSRQDFIKCFPFCVLKIWKTKNMFYQQNRIYISLNSQRLKFSPVYTIVYNWTVYRLWTK